MIMGIERRSLFDALPSGRVGAEERVDRLVGHNGVRVERIVSRGHASPPGFWYDQAENEWVLVASGRARLTIESEGTLDLGPGDHVTIPAHTRHRVEWTDPDEPTIWVAVFY